MLKLVSIPTLLSLCLKVKVKHEDQAEWDLHCSNLVCQILLMAHWLPLPPEETQAKGDKTWVLGFTGSHRL